MYLFGNNAFIAHPRTASRACGAALVDAGFEQVAGHHQIDTARCQKITDTGGTVACVTRNPFDIVVSWFFNSHFHEGGVRRREGEFGPWVKSGFMVDGRLNRYLHTKPYHYGLTVANKWIPYTSVNIYLKHFMDRCGALPVSMKPYGVLERERDYRFYYNDETKKIVENLFAVDFQITGYTF